jgi:choline monooxygenase
MSPTEPDLSLVHRPMSRTNGLANAHCINPQLYAEESQALLCKQWAGPAMATSIPNPGDAIPLTFFGIPLLLLRDQKGHVRVFQNTCRHRDMILLQEPRTITGLIRCPYHSWCYSTCDKLVSTPHVGGPGQNTHPDIDRSTLGLIDRSTLGLKEVRSTLWFDVMWINVSGDTAPFDCAMAEFDRPMYRAGKDSQIQLTVKTNWKLAVKNYCESYHLPWVHPGLKSYSRLEDHYSIEHLGVYSGQGMGVFQQIHDQNDRCFPDFEGLSDKWRTAAEYIAVYPNVFLGVHRGHTFEIIVNPEGPKKKPNI